MRHASLRLILLAGAALIALPALAQEAPPVVVVEPPAPASSDEPASEPAPEPATTAIPAAWAPVPVDEAGRSAYGLYLSGRVAGFRGEHDLAAEFLADSQSLTPEQPALTDEAFRAAVFSGDLDAVVRLAPGVQDVPLLADVGRLVEVVQFLRSGQGGAAWGALRARSLAEPFATLSRYMTPSVAAAAGDWEVALQPVGQTPDLFTGLLLRLQRARVLEGRRRFEEAETEFRALTAQPAGAALFNGEYAEFLERRGRREEARVLYQAALTGPAPDPSAAVGLRRVEAGARPPAAPTAVESAAEVLEFASMQMTAIEKHDYAVIYLRLAERLNPTDDIVLRLGHALAAAEQEKLARDTFARVTPANPIFYAGAQYNMALSLGREERLEEALEALRRADAAAPGQLAIAASLAAHLLDLERYDEALAVLNRPEVNTADQSSQLRFLRGSVLERMGRIEPAEAELWTALQAEPDDPLILNHLGYLWVDSGRRVDQGAEMIARALAADPQNGNIQDSLGWAQYRQGQYELAVETLEGAVAKEPGNAEIVDHLGDAYWQVGRRREAEWQWSRVLTLEPEPERRAEVERKLLRGLPPATPVQTASQP